MNIIDRRPKARTPRRKAAQNETPQNETPQNETAETAEITQDETPKKKTLRKKTPKNETTPRKAARHSDTEHPNTEHPNTERPKTRYRVTNRRVLRSEWFKFWSLRSSWITLAIAAVVMLGFGWLASATYSPDTTQTTLQGPPGSTTSSDAIGLALSGANLALLALGILGVLTGASEYTTGLIKNTLAAVPKRWPVLAAKAVVVGVVSLVAATIGAFLAFLVGGTAVPDSMALTLGSDGVIRCLFGAGAYLAMVGVIGVALGMLLRGLAGSIAVLIGTFLLLPNLIDLLPDSLADAISPYLPSNAGDSIMSLTTGDGSLSPGAGFAVMIGWVVVTVGAAIYQLKNKDA